MSWNSQLYRAKSCNINSQVLQNALNIGRRITHKNRLVQPVFTLNHLATASKVDYDFLRKIVARKVSAYSTFNIHKQPYNNKSRRYRTICVPDPALMNVQRWITKNILIHVPPHESSVAFSKGNSLYNAVVPHCSAKWLIKLDVSHFFESIFEKTIYNIFHQLGFEPLISFELARICTMLSPNYASNIDDLSKADVKNNYIIKEYINKHQGHLPQGAPSSPMLANLACRNLDNQLSVLSEEFSVEYTRYADDLTFSSKNSSFGRDKAKKLISLIYKTLVSNHLNPNKSKTIITTPGARKIVLGLQVENDTPQLTREFKLNLRQHLYYMSNPQIGVIKHAQKRKFSSTIGLKNHLLGLIHFSAQIEPDFAKRQYKKFSTIQWPI